MPNRKTGLDISAFDVMSGAYIGDLLNVEITKRNKTDEGKGIADIDDFPVLTGSSWEAQAELLVAGSASMALMDTAVGDNPAGTVRLVTGAGTYSGTAVITEARHRMEREGIQHFTITLTGRGNVGFA